MAWLMKDTLSLEGRCSGARKGGSYLIRVPMAQTGCWVDELGRTEDGARPTSPGDAVPDLVADMDPPFGRFRYVFPARALGNAHVLGAPYRTFGDARSRLACL